MSTITVANALKLLNLPEEVCFNSLTDLLKALPDLYSVEIPQTITNVVISSSEPSNLDALWVVVDASGSFVGLRLFTGGAWNQIYPTPNEIFWVWGDSTDIAPGYQLTDDDPNLTAAVKAHVKAMWLFDVPSGVYVYFSVTRTSF